MKITPHQLAPAVATVADEFGDRLLGDLRDTVQAAVPDERVLAVGVLSRPGSLATTAVMQVSSIAGLVRNASAKKAAAQLPPHMVVAMTPSRVLFFSFRPRLQSIVLKEQVRTLPRSGLRVRLEPGDAATRVVFTSSDGSSIHLERPPSVGSARRMHEPLMAELV